MFTILFSLFLMVVGITIGISYSAHQSTATSNGTITFNTPIYTITLDNANATTNGTSTIYEKYVIGTFANSQCTTQMTTSTNPITIPVRAYTVSYNSNGGSACSNQTATYTFNGYYTLASGGVQMLNSSGYTTNNFTSTYFSANTTLHAQWSSASITLPTPTYTGYTFGGWYGESTLTNKIGDGGDSYTPTSNKTLYAKWTANSPSSYDIYININGGTSYSGSTLRNYAPSSSIQQINIGQPTKNGALFDRWTIVWNDWAGSHSEALPSVGSNYLIIPANCYGDLAIFASWISNGILLKFGNNDTYFNPFDFSAGGYFYAVPENRGPFYVTTIGVITQNALDNCTGGESVEERADFEGYVSVEEYLWDKIENGELYMQRIVGRYRFNYSGSCKINGMNKSGYIIKVDATGGVLYVDFT